MKSWRSQLVIVAVFTLGITGAAQATSGAGMSSTDYNAVETEVGGNGQFNSNSSSYKIDSTGQDGGESLGESAIGHSGSTSYQTNAGFNTTAQPGLTFIVNTNSVSLGTLSPSVPGTGTATFSVKDYTSSGYMVTMIGTAPKMGSHTLTALTSDTASSPGTEQFGVNMVSDTSPAIAGSASPVQVPSSSFSFGVAGDGSTSNYIQTNKFRFNSGEVVASSPKTSGETDYTMSFLANINPLTPAGSYQGTVVLVVTGSY